ncbi:hypothetical protein SAMD00024442_52_10 [Candidatus Symbiothrix dinenymphae]|nr:hypothetical protein SAMD00024442_52_10 [Candidatus Symbiothrix dinenymphae]
MKKFNLFLVVAVAALYSCDNDIYDNIKEMVDKEKVYPAGYDQTFVETNGSKAGNERVEIDLYPRDAFGNRLSAAEMEQILSKAKKTVVEYGDTLIRIDSVCSWVNITGLTIPNTYRFKIYTEDEHGNKSIPVEITGRPLMEEDKSALQVFTRIVATSASQAIVFGAKTSDIYTVSSASYNYIDKNGALLSGETDAPIFTLRNLKVGQTTQVNISYRLLPNGAVDPVLVADTLEVTTLTQAASDLYYSETQPFPGQHIVSSATSPCIIPAIDFDTGGEGKAFHENDNTLVGDTYRADNGDANSAAVDVYTPYGWCIGWTSNGEWLIYTVEVVDEGIYSIEAAHVGNGRYHIELDNANISGPVATSGGGDISNYVWTMSVPRISLAPGTYKIKWFVEAGNNYYGIRITKI